MNCQGSNWDTIFKEGTHTSSTGVSREWTRTEIEKLVQNTGKDVPIVIHHPEDQSEATNFGKIAILRQKGGKLQAQYRDVPQILKMAVKEGLKLAKSVSIDPATMKIRHIGLLGAGQPPAVEGLGAANFSADDKGNPLLTYLFNHQTNNTNNEEGQMDPKDQKIKDLEDKIKTMTAGKETEQLQGDLDHAKKKLKTEQDAHQKTKDEFSKFKGDQEDTALQARIDALAESGRIKPADKKKAMAFAKALPGDKESMDFSKADGTTEKVTPRELYIRDLEAREGNKDSLLTEFAKPDGAGPGADDGADLSDINDYA